MKEIGTINGDFTVNEENAIKFSEVFRSIFNIEFNKKLLNELDYTYDCFTKFMDKYLSIDEELRYKLDDAMRGNETVFSHGMELKSEEEEAKLVNSLADDTISQGSISYICNYIRTKNFDITSIKELHNILMEGAISNNKNTGYRSDDSYYVGYPTKDGKIHVQYFPPLAKTIELSMEMILFYLNDPELNQKIPNTYLEGNNEFDKKYALFIQPLITLALVTVLQSFGDGNGRLGREIGCAVTLKHTNQIFDRDFKLPLIYFSFGYLGFRQQFRNFIRDIAINPNSELWNNWLIFGLHAVQDYIAYCENIIKENLLIEKSRIKKKEIH